METRHILGAVLVLVSGTAFGQTQVPNTFQPGTPARAAEVNDNFTTVASGVNNNAQGVTNNTVALSGVSQNVSGNAQNISGNTQNIAANTQNIDTVSQSVASMMTAQPEFKFVGFSTAQVNGGAGFFGMAAACQADFGPDSRMATSKEIVESTIQPVLNATHAWVQPVVVAGNLDISGYAGAGNCNAWSATVGSGLCVMPNGGFVHENCSVARPVACSALQ